MLESSIEIDKDVKLIISVFTSISGVSQAWIIKELLRMVNSRYSYTPTLPGLIQYQRKQSKENWKKLRYKLTQEEKELFEEMRTKYKMSISHLVFIGFILFFDELAFNVSCNNVNLRNYGKTHCKSENFMYSYTPKSVIINKIHNSCWMINIENP